MHGATVKIENSGGKKTGIMQFYVKYMVLMFPPPNDFDRFEHFLIICFTYCTCVPIIMSLIPFNPTLILHHFYDFIVRIIL